MSEAPPVIVDPWQRHTAEQRRAWLTLTHSQRLAWLDQAKRFCAGALGAASPRNVVANKPGEGRNRPR